MTTAPELLQARIRTECINAGTAAWGGSRNVEATCPPGCEPVSPRTLLT